MEKKKQKKLSSPKSRALRLLTVRNRTTEELRQRMLQDGYEPSDVEEVIVWLLEIGYLNDRQTAAYWVDYRCRFRPTGIMGLSHELRRKGISDEIISEVMISREEETDLAMELANARVKPMAGLPIRTQYQRIGGLLNRRGFSWDVVRKVLDSLFGSSLDTNL